ncbi:MAG: 30S ribosomal protein S21 [Flavobacteriaceae bacterium]|nr:30S ribosomal protein S21 [Flavobacteriaceae bacterium]
MIYVTIKDNDSLDKAIKKFKKKFEKTGVVKEYRSRMSFEKPCITRRQQLIKARYKLKVQREAKAGQA